MTLESMDDKNGNLKQKITKDLLKKKTEMLDELFCKHINQVGNLTGFPVILDHHNIPGRDYVPEFLLSLSNDVGPEIYFQSWLIGRARTFRQCQLFLETSMSYMFLPCQTHQVGRFNSTRKEENKMEVLKS